MTGLYTCAEAYLLVMFSFKEPGWSTNDLYIVIKYDLVKKKIHVHVFLALKLEYLAISWNSAVLLQEINTDWNWPQPSSPYVVFSIFLSDILKELVVGGCGFHLKIFLMLLIASFSFPKSKGIPGPKNKKNFLRLGIKGTQKSVIFQPYCIRVIGLDM